MGVDDHVPPPKNPLPKQCLFCDHNGRLTREDYFPEWLAALFPKAPNNKTRATHKVTRLRADGNTIHVFEGDGRQAKQGRTVDQTLRVLCQSCNNEKLGRLQERAKPILTPLIQGVWIPKGRVDLNTIASWAVMTTMVLEAADPPTISIPKRHRVRFRDTYEPPPGTLVYMAPTTSKKDAAFNHRALVIGLEEGPQHRAQCTTLQVGKLLLQVITSSEEVAIVDQMEHADDFGLLPIWPPPLWAEPVNVRMRDQAGVSELYRTVFAPGAIARIPSLGTRAPGNPEEFS